MRGNKSVGRIAVAAMLIAGVWGAQAWAAPPVMATAPETSEVMISIGDAYVPSGFDSNSEPFVVVSGFFPNTCYQWKEAVVSHSASNRHEIRSMGRINEGMCLMMLVPFTQEVQLGKLEKGDHELRFVNADGTYLEKHMIIE